MVVVGAVGAVDLEEGKLRLVLFALDQNLLEFRAVQRHVLCSFLKKFYIGRAVLLISPGGMMRPIIDLL